MADASRFVTVPNTYPKDAKNARSLTNKRNASLLGLGCPSIISQSFATVQITNNDASPGCCTAEPILSS
eukprot:scaffold340891_cov17-Prasinocladus_malaysianus.AAC.1